MPRQRPLRPIQIQEVTVTATQARREEPLSSVSVSAAVIQRTPAINAYDLLRQTAGIEVHDQGQGPGFASNASVRGFSSDHSTDLALWIDGVPINEPVNGHAEGYNDWSLLFPAAVSSIDISRRASRASLRARCPDEVPRASVAPSARLVDGSGASRART